MSPVLSSRLASARVAGMRLRAALDPPRAAVGTFPYPHRTCAEWDEVEPSTEMTMKERRKDARQGSRKLRDAMRRASA